MVAQREKESEGLCPVKVRGCCRTEASGAGNWSILEVLGAMGQAHSTAAMASEMGGCSTCWDKGVGGNGGNRRNL